jgi:hypothetical protein
MDEKVLASDPAHAAGFRYFYELTVGSIIAAFLTFQGWLTVRQIRHGEQIAKLEAERITRDDFERWREEQQVQLDELRASSIASGEIAVRIVRESSEKLERQLERGLDKEEHTQRELLMALAKKGIDS